MCTPVPEIRCDPHVCAHTCCGGAPLNLTINRPLRVLLTFITGSQPNWGWLSSEQLKAGSDSVRPSVWAKPGRWAPCQGLHSAYSLGPSIGELLTSPLPVLSLIIREAGGGPQRHSNEQVLSRISDSISTRRLVLTALCKFQ